VTEVDNRSKGDKGEVEPLLMVRRGRGRLSFAAQLQKGVFGGILKEKIAISLQREGAFGEAPKNIKLY
jgi:hypothetical protein